MNSKQTRVLVTVAAILVATAAPTVSHADCPNQVWAGPNSCYSNSYPQLTTYTDVPLSQRTYHPSNNNMELPSFLGMPTSTKELRDKAVETATKGKVPLSKGDVFKAVVKQVFKTIIRWYI